MFFKKPQEKCISPVIYIALGMAAAFGLMACTKPGKKFIKAKMQCIEKKLDSCGCDALSS